MKNKLIPKYQNPWSKLSYLEPSDNTRVAPIIIPDSKSLGKITPVRIQALFNQDNRTYLLKDKDKIKSERISQNYEKSKDTEKAMRDLFGFLNLTDAVGLVTGVGTLIKKGLSHGIKLVSKKALSDDIANSSQETVESWLREFPNSKLTINKGPINIDLNTPVYKLGTLPFSDDALAISRVMENRFGNFVPSVDMSINTFWDNGKKVMVGNGIPGYFERLRNSPAILYTPYKNTSIGGVQNRMGAFIKADSRSHYDYTHVHEGLAHRTDDIVENLNMPHNNEPVMDSYRRISYPTDLFDASELNHFSWDSLKDYEARAANWEMITSVYKAASKFFKKPIDKISIDEFNTIVKKALDTPEKLSAFMKTSNSRYLHDYSKLLDLKTPSSLAYYKRLINAIKYLPAVLPAASITKMNNSKYETNTEI